MTNILSSRVDLAEKVPADNNNVLKASTTDDGNQQQQPPRTSLKERAEEVGGGIIDSTKAADGKRRTSSIRKPDETLPVQKGRLERFRAFVYDSKTGAILGRTSINWVKIMLFYFVFWTCVGVIFALGIFVLYAILLSGDEPRLTYNVRPKNAIFTAPGMQVVFPVLRKCETNDEPFAKCMNEDTNLKIPPIGGDENQKCSGLKDVVNGDAYRMENEKVNYKNWKQFVIILRLNRMLNWKTDITDADKMYAKCYSVKPKSVSLLKAENGKLLIDSNKEMYNSYHVKADCYGKDNVAGKMPYYLVKLNMNPESENKKVHVQCFAVVKDTEGNEYFLNEHNVPELGKDDDKFFEKLTYRDGIGSVRFILDLKKKEKE